MNIVVGSTNRTKILPVRTIFRKHFPHVHVAGISVDSGVSEQPSSDDEIFLGAKNRAIRSLESVRTADMGVGIEGGIVHRSYGVFEYSLVVIADRKGAVGIGSSGGLVLPRAIEVQIQRGKTLEEAIDQEFNTTNIGEGMGMFGIMTCGSVTRATGIEHGVAFALARFLHKELYERTVV